MQAKHIIITCGAWHHENFGGAYKAAAEFAEFLAKEGHRVSCIAWTREPSFSNPALHNGVEIWRYPAPRGKSPSVANAAAHILHSRRLARKIAAGHRVDHLNGHDFLQFIGSAAALRSNGTRTSFSVHSPLVFENMVHWGLLDAGPDKKATLKQELALSALRCTEAATYRRAEVIQTDSRYTLGVIGRDYPSAAGGKGVAAPLWVDLDRFSCCEDKSVPRGKLGGAWQSDRPLFFTLRRLVPRMGIDSLIQAVSLLKIDGLDCRLVIGGAGPERERLEALVCSFGVGDRVFFAGRIADEDLPLCFRAADCFVLPTRALECFGLIILEAYASGTPVIGTPVGSIPEVMGEIGASFVAADAGAPALSRKMAEFIAGTLPVEREKLRSHAETFGYERRARDLYQVITGGVAG